MSGDFDDCHHHITYSIGYGKFPNIILIAIFNIYHHVPVCEPIRVRYRIYIWSCSDIYSLYIFTTSSVGGMQNFIFSQNYICVNFIFLTANYLDCSSCEIIGMSLGPITWWRHQMETFSALLAICAGNSPVPGEIPTQRPVTRSFFIFYFYFKYIYTG